jgi:ATP-binding cassette, subfamily B, bacterial MsbA
VGFPVTRRLLVFLRPYPWALPVLVVLGLLSSLSEGLGLGLLIPLMGIVLHESEATMADAGPLVEYTVRYASVFDEDVRLFALCVIVVLLVGLKGLIQCGYAVIAAGVIERVTHNLRMALVRQLFEVGYAHIVQSDQGKILNTLHGESQRAGQALNSLAFTIAGVCAVVVFFVLLLLISWKMTLALCAGGLIGSLAVRMIVRLGQTLGGRAVTAWDQLSERTIDVLHGMRVIRVFTQEEREIARFEKVSDDTRSIQWWVLAITNMTYPLMEVIYLPLLIGVLATGLYLDLAIPVIITFLILVYRMLPYVKNVDTHRVFLARFAGTVEVVNEALRRDNKPYLVSGTARFERLQSGITFENVSFSYAANVSRVALDGVSLQLNKGEMVALVGRSGSGKSTLINLLCRLYDPTTGRILVDGRPLPEFELRSWRRRLGLAGQDAELMSGTVLENIAFGRDDVGMAEIVAVAKRVLAHDFIEALPAGYQTAVGPQGTRLSGGQRQRIGLARALLRQPDILILDEATNALDSLTETVIKETLDNLAGSVTMLIVAHRLSTVRSADRVVVLEGGRVIEQGRPGELARSRGAFANLAEIQQLEPAATR